LDADSIRSLFREAHGSDIALDTTTLEYVIRRRVEKEAEGFAANPDDPEVLDRLRSSLDLLPSVPFPVVIWEVQNIAYAPLIKALDQLTGSTNTLETQLENLLRLAEQLKIRVPQAMLQAA
jgi:hypothetical protein